MGRYRWIVCALLFFATTINYIDRQVLGILAPDLQKSIGWNEVEYGYIVTAFTGAYALGLLLTGRILDRIGTRLGFAIAVVLWSLAAMAHGLARTALGFGIARFLLGLGEAANFPASIKTVAEWFPRKERAFATGIFNAGSNVGPIVVPLTVPWIAVTYGWPWAFVLTGAIGFVWLVVWLAVLPHPRDASARHGGGARLHPQRPARGDHPGALAPARRLPPDLGLRPRQAHDRSHLVVLPLLAAQVPEREARPRPPAHRPAPHRHLPDRRRGQRGRRLAVLGPHQARLVGERRAARRPCCSARSR